MRVRVSAFMRWLNDQSRPLSSGGLPAISTREENVLGAAEEDSPMIRAALPFAVLLLAGCARSEEANLLLADNGNSRVAEQVRSEHNDQEPALGAWRDTIQDTQRALEFGPQGAPPLFSLACDDRHGLILERHGIQPAGDLPVMLISVGSETRRLAVTGGEGPIPMLRASLSPSDQLATNLAQATGPIVIRIGEAQPLILPPDPQIGAYIEQCESGSLATPGASTTGNSAAPAGDAAPANAAGITG
jgi:hypothetical protein